MKTQGVKLVLLGFAFLAILGVLRGRAAASADLPTQLCQEDSPCHAEHPLTDTPQNSSPDMEHRSPDFGGSSLHDEPLSRATGVQLAWYGHPGYYNYYYRSTFYGGFPPVQYRAYYGAPMYYHYRMYYPGPYVPYGGYYRSYYSGYGFGGYGGYGCRTGW